METGHGHDRIEQAQEWENEEEELREASSIPSFFFQLAIKFFKAELELIKLMKL